MSKQGDRNEKRVYKTQIGWRAIHTFLVAISYDNDLWNTTNNWINCPPSVIVLGERNLLQIPPLFDAVNVGNDSFNNSWRHCKCCSQTCSLLFQSYRGWGRRMSHTTSLGMGVAALRRTVEIISVVIDGIEESPFAEDDYGR
uniref:Uncharacterized protein n=1 Tax=Corethron hystrix TaxID=216773 RepID=A0A6U5KS95_9STRA|mmetsp:Transcript_41817/g.97943  ORF Transcript_41817/g.97943 Transcript_41817/m.97943 type:complete len:142 (+) Transcript_41817:330-755(+)